MQCTESRQSQDLRIVRCAASSAGRCSRVRRDRRRCSYIAPRRGWRCGRKLGRNGWKCGGRWREGWSRRDHGVAGYGIIRACLERAGFFFLPSGADSRPCHRGQGFSGAAFTPVGAVSWNGGRAHRRRLHPFEITQFWYSSSLPCSVAALPCSRQPVPPTFERWFHRPMFGPRWAGGGRGSGRPREISIHDVTLREAGSGRFVLVRVEGDYTLGRIDTGHEIEVEGTERNGTIFFRAGYNHFFSAEIRVNPRPVSGMLVTASSHNLPAKTKFLASNGSIEEMISKLNRDDLDADSASHAGDSVGIPARQFIRSLGWPAF